jgi:hypothetical protein
MKPLTFAKYVRKKPTYHRFFEKVERKYVKRRCMLMIHKLISTSTFHGYRSNMIYPKFKSVKDLHFHIEGAGFNNYEKANGIKYKAIWRRRSFQQWYDLYRSYFNYTPIQTLVSLMGLGIENFYCYDAKKRVWCAHQYHHRGLGRYSPESQAITKDEYNMFRSDWYNLYNKVKPKKAPKLTYGKEPQIKILYA